MADNTFHRLGVLEGRMQGMDQRLDSIDERFDKVDEKAEQILGAIHELKQSRSFLAGGLKAFTIFAGSGATGSALTLIAQKLTKALGG